MLNAWPDGSRLIHRFQAGSDQILNIDELHQPAAVARQDDGPVCRADDPRRTLRDRNGFPGRR